VKSRNPKPEGSAGSGVLTIALPGSDFAVDYVDVREDRVVLYGSVGKAMSTFIYKIKATNAGKVVTPAVHAESMYDRSVRARVSPGISPSRGRDGIRHSCPASIEDREQSGFRNPPACCAIAWPRRWYYAVAGAIAGDGCELLPHAPLSSRCHCPARSMRAAASFCE
jgi:hypothetical protein